MGLQTITHAICKVLNLYFPWKTKQLMGIFLLNFPSEINHPVWLPPPFHEGGSQSHQLEQWWLIRPGFTAVMVSQLLDLLTVSSSPLSFQHLSWRVFLHSPFPVWFLLGSSDKDSLKMASLYISGHCSLRWKYQELSIYPGPDTMLGTLYIF